MILLLVQAEAAAKQARAVNTPDESLMTRMAQGDTEALECLYAQTKSAVYGFALSILRNSQNAEDVMQDTFVAVFTKAASYRPMGKPMAWVLTIARNLALMKLRESGRTEPALDEEWKLPQQPGFEGKSLDKLVLQAALSILSDEERQIVMLHCVSGLRHREIAELLQLPLGTVLPKYRRALAKLQKNIKEEA